jgi:hypothetical protein
MDWAWGKEAQFQSDVVPQVGLDGKVVTNYGFNLVETTDLLAVSEIIRARFALLLVSTAGFGELCKLKAGY